MKKVTSGGGWPAIRYALQMAQRAGGVRRLYRALRSGNACKTCALGMGGQKGGMVDESGRFPEVCKKSMQAMAADMQGRIDPAFFARYSLPAMEQFTPRELEHMGRLTEPVYAAPEDSHYRCISWDEAYELCIQRLKNTPPDENFFYVSGRSSNEAGFLLQLFARMYGTNNVNNCSYYCHQASGVGLTSAFGSGTATVVLEDLERCDLVLLIGGNPASNHPRLMSQLMRLRRRGGQVVVVNPIVEIGLQRFKVPSNLRSLLFGSPIASEYVQPHIGGDIALLSGIAKRIDELGAVDERFIQNGTTGWDGFVEHIRGLTWDEITDASGVRRDQIQRVADLYARANNVIFAWTMGITQHLHGVDNVRSIANLALMRGMVGKPGSGLLPIRGHSNVQGVGSMGVTPKLKDAIFERLQTHYGVQLPQSSGLDTLSCLEAMENGQVRSGWCLGGNLYGATPDSRRAQKSFANLEWICYLSTTLNTGHASGRGQQTLILPVLVRDEEQQSTTQESMFNFVRLSNGGPRRLSGPRSEVEIIAHLGREVLAGPFDWQALAEHRRIRDVIAGVVPGYERIGRMDVSAEEFQIAGRTFHQPKFATASGRANFKATTIPPLRRSAEQLMLMTLRSEGQFNTVVYEEQDIYRHQERRDVILMNPADIERLGLHVDQRVTVRGAGGEMQHILVREFAIRAGNAAMYFPEANFLIPQSADAESRTPAFKAIAVTLHPETADQRSSSPAKDFVTVGTPRG